MGRRPKSQARSKSRNRNQQDGNQQHQNKQQQQQYQQQEYQQQQEPAADNMMKFRTFWVQSRKRIARDDFFVRELIDMIKCNPYWWLDKEVLEVYQRLLRKLHNKNEVAELKRCHRTRDLQAGDEAGKQKYNNWLRSCFKSDQERFFFIERTSRLFCENWYLTKTCRDPNRSPDETSLGAHETLSNELEEDWILDGFEVWVNLRPRLAGLSSHQMIAMIQCNPFWYFDREVYVHYLMMKGELGFTHDQLLSLKDQDPNFMLVNEGEGVESIALDASQQNARRKRMGELQKGYSKRDLDVMWTATNLLYHQYKRRTHLTVWKTTIGPEAPRSREQSPVGDVNGDTSALDISNADTTMDTTAGDLDSSTAPTFKIIDKLIDYKTERGYLKDYLAARSADRPNGTFTIDELHSMMKDNVFWFEDPLVLSLVDKAEAQIGQSNNKLAKMFYQWDHRYRLARYPRKAAAAMGMDSQGDQSGQRSASRSRATLLWVRGSEDQVAEKFEKMTEGLSEEELEIGRGATRFMSGADDPEN